MKRKGTIYTEYHNRGKNRGGVGGSVFRKGAGLVRSSQYRWVAEISCYGKRYRCRSHHYGRVLDWLHDMQARFNG